MRLLFLILWIPILSYSWEECIFTKCKPFWNNKCTPPDDLEKHGGHTEVCEGLLWIRHLCCKERKHQIDPSLHVVARRASKISDSLLEK
ncbi:hypothetical protein B9Z55_005980 [Caenorhabditis nigoni]|uniref:Uncharacterized protein n=1 Tax=Caenorhabditis nigoni TaxID=1611254 RepID=A0A2G5V395_9PELO|nr:hypothetical protein B9Z55_005980 [Caenorhabditis nigoni]